MAKLLSTAKLLVVPSGRSPRTIKSGAFQGLSMDLDLTCQTQLYLGLFEREVYKWLETLSTGINTAIDVGAGEGEYTLFFLAKTSAQEVFTFEPDPTNRKRLMMNLNLNEFSRDPRLVFSSRFVGSSDKRYECSLDSLISSISLPCVIKIDVDGSEVDVLQGGGELLGLPQISWIIETHSKQLEDQCIRMLRQAGFETTIVPQAWWRCFIPELRPTPLNRWLVATRGLNSGTPA